MRYTKKMHDLAIGDAIISLTSLSWLPQR